MNKNIVKIEYKHNPLLINGEVLIVNSIKIDNSSLGKLNKLSSELLN